MASNELTLRQLQAVFANMTLSLFPTYSQSPSSNQQIAKAYAPNGQPLTEITQDKIFFWVVRVSDPIAECHDTFYTPEQGEDLIESKFYNYRIRCDWSFYGPDCQDNANMLWRRLQDVDIRAQLYPYLIFPVKFNEPILLNDSYNDQYLLRSDLCAEYYYSFNSNFNIPTIDTFNIVVYEDNGYTVSSSAGSSPALIFTSPSNSQYIPFL